MFGSTLKEKKPTAIIFIGVSTGGAGGAQAT